MATKKSTKVRIPSARSEDQPATRKMLSLVRDEVCHRMDAGFGSVKAEIHELKADIHGVKSEVQSLKSDIHGVKSEVHGLKSGFDKLDASYSRMALLLEEQSSNNRIVLEGLQALWQRQDRLEARQR